MIEKFLLTQPLPQILIIQLGSNDLGIAKGKELIELIRCDILRLRTLYPDLKINLERDSTKAILARESQI
jgi:hypothetical protein